MSLWSLDCLICGLFALSSVWRLVDVWRYFNFSLLAILCEIGSVWSLGSFKSLSNLFKIWSKIWKTVFQFGQLKKIIQVCCLYCFLGDCVFRLVMISLQVWKSRNFWFPGLILGSNECTVMPQLASSIAQACNLFFQLWSNDFRRVLYTTKSSFPFSRRCVVSVTSVCHKEVEQLRLFGPYWFHITILTDILYISQFVNVFSPSHYLSVWLEQRRLDVEAPLWPHCLRLAAARSMSSRKWGQNLAMQPKRWFQRCPTGHVFVVTITK